MGAALRRPADGLRSPPFDLLRLPTDVVYLWSILLLSLRFGTIFKDAASKTGQNQGCHEEEEKQAGRSAPRCWAPSDTTGPFCSKNSSDSEVISAVDIVAKLRKLDRSRFIEGALRQWLKEEKTASVHKERLRACKAQSRRHKADRQGIRSASVARHCEHPEMTQFPPKNPA